MVLKASPTSPKPRRTLPAPPLKHTVSDGKTTYHKKELADVTQTVLHNPEIFQGKITHATRYRDQGRDGIGNFTTPIMQ